MTSHGFGDLKFGSPIHGFDEDVFCDFPIVVNPPSIESNLLFFGGFLKQKIQEVLARTRSRRTHVGHPSTRP